MNHLPPLKLKSKEKTDQIITKKYVINIQMKIIMMVLMMSILNLDIVQVIN